VIVKNENISEKSRQLEEKDGEKRNGLKNEKKILFAFFYLLSSRQLFHIKLYLKHTSLLLEILNYRIIFVWVLSVIVKNENISE
jgi:hypothetical protein